MDLCLAEEQRPGMRVLKRWRGNDFLELEGMRTED